MRDYFVEWNRMGNKQSLNHRKEKKRWKIHTGRLQTSWFQNSICSLISGSCGWAIQSLFGTFSPTPTFLLAISIVPVYTTTEFCRSCLLGITSRGSASRRISVIFLPRGAVASPSLAHQRNWEKCTVLPASLPSTNYQVSGYTRKAEGANGCRVWNL